MAIVVGERRLAALEIPPIVWKKAPLDPCARIPIFEVVEVTFLPLMEDFSESPLKHFQQPAHVLESLKIASVFGKRASASKMPPKSVVESSP